MNKTCYTALIGSYEDLKTPSVPSPGWDFVCFTDQPLTSDVWKIVQVQAGEGAQRTARRIKILFHEYIDTQYSMWLDAAFQINVDLNWIWKYFKSPFSAPRHPLRHDIFLEIESCIANERGNRPELEAQHAAYKEQGALRHGNNIITSGLLMRENTAACIELCEAWYAELCKYSVRDQPAFARVSERFNWLNFEMGNSNCTFPWDYSQSQQLKYIRHYKHRN